MTPRSMRELDEKDLSAFASKHGVSRATLYRWGETEQFVSDIKQLNIGIMPVRLQDVRNATYESAVLKRDVNAQKLYLQYETGWLPTEKREVSGKITMSGEEIAKIVKESMNVK